MGVVYSHGAPRAYRPPPPISLLLAIATGAGLAGASGVRPFLPPLLAGALAGANVGIDFERGTLDFLESPIFLFAVLVLAVGAYAAERRRVARPLEIGLALAGGVLGALLCAGAISAAQQPGWIGLIVGAACAALGFFAVARLLARARARAATSAAPLFAIYADVVALVLAAVAIFAEPLALVALLVFVVLLVRSRSERGRKYEGLRILR